MEIPGYARFFDRLNPLMVAILTSPFHWLVNGRYFATEVDGRTLQWTPPLSGATRLTVIDGRGRSDSVGFRVQRSGVRYPADRG